MATSRTDEEEDEHQQQLYRQQFNTNDYLKTYCKTSTPYFRLLQGALHNVFALEVTSGESFLDIATGPSPYKTISASKRFKNMVVSINLESNRNLLRKWLQADADCHDFGIQFTTTAALEENRNYHELEDRVRQSVKEVIPCNVNLANPIAPDERTFDVITCSCILESANPSVEMYRQAIANISGLLNSGGKFILVGALESTFYLVGDKKLPVPYLTKDIVNQALLDAGLLPIQWVLLPLVEKEATSDCLLMFLTVATKPIK